MLLEKFGLPAAANRWIAILGVDAAGHPKTPSVMLAIAAPTLFGLVVGWLLSLTLGREDHPGLDYTWKCVMSRPAPSRRREPRAIVPSRRR